MLLLSLALAVLRWLLIGLFIDRAAVQIGAQSLHAFSFGAFHASAIHLAHHYFPGPTQGRGQALYNSVGFGVGGAVGSLTSGLLWSSAGPTMTFVAASLMAALGWIAAYGYVDKARRY
jgi:PPP family 3-phenylpropionic acid transporter